MFIIANPVAGRGRGREIWPTVAEELARQGMAFEFAFTKYPGHAAELSAQAVRAGHDLVVAVGGDGTLTEVVNGLVGSEVRLGLIPVGTGNDFARSLAIPTDPAQAVQVLGDETSIMVDLGQVGQDYFINVAGVGFDAQVAMTMAQKAHWLKGTSAYIYAVLRSLITCKPFPLVLRLDGVEYCFHALLVAVANGQYIGGGMRIAPLAETDDGLFDVVVLENLSAAAFLRAFPTVFKGEHLSHPKVKLFRAKRVEVIPVAEGINIPAQAEGNFIGHAPKEFRIIPGVQQVLVPAAVAQRQPIGRREAALGWVD